MLTHSMGRAGGQHQLKIWAQESRGITPRSSSSDRIGFIKKTFLCVLTARIVNTLNIFFQGLTMDYSSAFIVYMAVFESPSILLFNEKVVSHWLLFYAQKSFHLPSLITVEFTKFTYYCTYILSTHLHLVPQQQVLQMHVDFPAWEILCWWKDAQCYRHQLSILVLLWPWSPALSPDSHRNSVPSFQMQIFPIPSCIDLMNYHLHSWPAGQATLWLCQSLCRPFTRTQLFCGQQRVDPPCFVRRRSQNFSAPQAGQGYQGHFAAVRLTDQLPATAGRTSCTPGEGRAVHRLFNTWITWPRCQIFCQIIVLSWSL